MKKKGGWLGLMGQSAATKLKGNLDALLFGMVRILKKNRKNVFEFLVAEVNKFNWKLKFERKFLNFLKGRILEFGQGIRSSKFELKV
jgi:hypothetical protein